MLEFKQLVEKMTASTGELKLKIDGQEKTLIALARYRTDNFPENEYLKAAFDDGSFLLVLLDDQKLMYTSQVQPHLKEITDDQIGREPRITLLGQEFVLVNANDYQEVREFYFGTTDQLEGEVRFSDYETADGSQTLSLGWLAKNNQRADMKMTQLDLEQIQL